MKLVKIQLLIMLVATASIIAQDTTNASNTTYPPLEIDIGNSRTLLITGFGDFLAEVEGEKDAERFSVNQAEIELASDLSDKFSVALAIAYDEENFTIGTFTADYLLFESSENRNSGLGINELYVGGGQFDVPFGIDHHVYPSIDRKIVSSPLVVENTHDSWNDYGAYLNAQASWGNATFFAANGFSHECSDPTGEEIAAHNDFAVGSRAGIQPHSTVEIGGSFAYLYGLDQNHDMILAGVDLLFNYGDFELKGEYIAHKFDNDNAVDFTNDGYYLQALYNINDWYLVSRFGEYRPNQNDADISRLSSGIGRKLGEIAVLRFEYQINESEKNKGILQVAFSF